MTATNAAMSTTTKPVLSELDRLETYLQEAKQRLEILKPAFLKALDVHPASALENSENLMEAAAICRQANNCLIDIAKGRQMRTDGKHIMTDIQMFEEVVQRMRTNMMYIVRHSKKSSSDLHNLMYRLEGAALASFLEDIDSGKI
jgi:hypothetical protein